MKSYMYGHSVAVSRYDFAIACSCVLLLRHSATFLV